MKLNKDMYKVIKKMNREEMQQYLEDNYIQGFRAGSHSSNDADFRIKLSKILQDTKGVGEILYNKIMAKAKEELNV